VPLPEGASCAAAGAMGNEQSVLTQYDIEHVQQYVNGQCKWCPP